MQEAFLHYVWKYQKWNAPGLKLVSGESVSVLHPGKHNDLAGPDFLDARIRINETLWAGHVEIHINASDWYAHRHEGDSAYDNVILHVVWNDNMPVLHKEGVPFPTLELSDAISHSLYVDYTKLIRQRPAFIPCEKEIETVNKIVVDTWLERLCMERLQHRVQAIMTLKSDLGGHWEAVFFILLAQGFGSRINKEPFRAMAMKIPYRVLCRVRGKPYSLEALFMGMAGLLEIGKASDPYQIALQKEFKYVCRKYNLDPFPQPRAHFYKLRPHNFPTIRLSQLAQLYYRLPDLLTECIRLNSATELYPLLRTAASTYWERHYIFGKSSTAKPKITTNAFMDTLLINVILPVKFAYARDKGDEGWEIVSHLFQQIRPERNSILRQYAHVGIGAASAMDSQALLELHSGYCMAKRCLECAIGHRLLGRM